MSAVVSRLFTFVAGNAGPWRVLKISPVVGDSLSVAARVSMVAGPVGDNSGSVWWLRGITSNERYVTRAEKDELVAKQEGLGRPGSNCAALIPIRKNAAWWALTQDERRQVFEETSRHIAIGMPYLPAIARRLHHCRDLSEKEPFDFLTWFEYRDVDAQAFEDLVAALRSTEEWRYVEREVDVRLIKD
jgi:hypothetical protein